LPGRILPAVSWTGVFAAGAAWFGYQTLCARRGAPATPWRSPHPGPHLVECAAMLYMLLAVPASAAAAGAGGMSAAGVRAASAGAPLALLLALFLLGWVVRVAGRLTVRAPAFAAPLGLPAALTAGSASGGTAGGGAAGPGDTAGAGCGPADPASGRRHLAPRCAVLRKIAMGITMGYVLILML
jgi:hypothetical protein